MENSIGKIHKKTIYFGGGTPSILSQSETQEILECFPFYRESDIEITIEMNPEDITPEYIAGILTLGIIRISLGIQTLNEKSLKEIHRSDRNMIFGALESINPEIKKSNNNISLNLDFILGLPFVKPGETLAGIRELHKRFPYITHTSVYMLEDESYPKHWRENSITEDEMQSDFIAIMEYFKTIGWHHYELSNWARPEYESVHNQAYWDHSDTRGFGLSAASYEGGQRWNNSSSFTGYYGSRRDNEESLTPEQIVMEQMMFGLRRDGWDYDKGSKKLDTLITGGLLEIHENRIKPTKTGIFVIDHILSELI
ncbi:radical SAM protein [Candidatus Gracilibacteria bacterium]|nr:radical SAM protein [Candidatus Gracilibacteria bacterium]